MLIAGNNSTVGLDSDLFGLGRANCGGIAIQFNSFSAALLSLARYCLTDKIEALVSDGRSLSTRSISSTISGANGRLIFTAKVRP